MIYHLESEIIFSIFSFPLFLVLDVEHKMLSLIELFSVADDIVPLSLLFSPKLNISSSGYEFPPHFLDFYL